MAKRRFPLWLILIVLFPGLILAFVVGLWTWMTATKPTLHPDPRAVPSSMHSTPSTQWADAVAKARQIVREGLARQNIPGLSVAIGVGGELVWAEGFGWADLENQVAVTPDTPFRIGTASKMLSSAAIGLLVEQGRLKLDDEIQAHVPQFPKKQWPVTLRHLMGHLAGVRRDSGDEEPVTMRCEGTLDAMPRFANASLRFEPGRAFHYSNYGWILLSGAIEAAAGERYFTFMRKQIFEPLGMAHTSADAGTEPTGGRAVYYFPRFAANPYYGHQGPEHVDFSCFVGASAFLSTPSDMVRFLTAVNSGKLLQPETVQLLQTSQRLTSGAETGYGLGWDLETVTLSGEQTRQIGYDGDLRDGIVSTFMSLAERRIVVAVIANISFADTPSLALSIAELFTEQKKSPAAK